VTAAAVKRFAVSNVSSICNTRRPCTKKPVLSGFAA
jgi:hypothetical protein